MKTYRFSIEEIDSDRETFNVLYPFSKTASEIVEEAARLFYYGKAGHQEAWPLTFVIETMAGDIIARAYVFIKSSLPDFEVVLCETPPRAPTRGLNELYGGYNETSRPGPWRSLWARVGEYLSPTFRDHTKN